MLDFDKIQKLVCVNEKCKRKLKILTTNKNSTNNAIYCVNCRDRTIIYINNYENIVSGYSLNYDKFKIISNSYDEMTTIINKSGENITLNKYYNIDLYDQNSWKATGLKYLKLMLFS